MNGHKKNILFSTSFFFALESTRRMDLKRPAENGKERQAPKRKRLTKNEKMTALLQDDVSMLSQVKMDQTIMAQLVKNKSLKCIAAAIGADDIQMQSECLFGPHLSLDLIVYILKAVYHTTPDAKLTAKPKCETKERSEWNLMVAWRVLYSVFALSCPVEEARLVFDVLVYEKYNMQQNKNLSLCLSFSNFSHSFCSDALESRESQEVRQQKQAITDALVEEPFWVSKTIVWQWLSRDPKTFDLITNVQGPLVNMDS
jgi:hypothetical protein